MARRHGVFIAAAAAAGLMVAAVGCEKVAGPSSKAEVCKGFEELGTQLLQGNGVIGNPLFHKADDLGDLAESYEGTADLSQDANRLHEIADSDSTSGSELEGATRQVAALCGHPLGLGTGFGSP
ncbi:molybdenum ABC transporter substrate-binding protein [Streptomyces sp. NPDC047108]|uniref:molybdenum ABC transporter substrate-binding protein n=1 Tax=Streptomyces sp. NPDC047108 TaxID=3155025 RepID=UPI0033F368B2